MLMLGLAACGQQSTSGKPRHSTSASHHAAVSHHSSPSSKGAGPSNLPPPGHPLLGHKPPMPEPVIITSPEGYKVETVASGLIVPWDIAFVSPNRIYVTERPGRVRLIVNGVLKAKPYALIPVSAHGEGGLLGIVLHPKYPNPRWVYLMYTHATNGHIYNRISRFIDTGSGLDGEKVLVDGIQAAMYHNGGRIRFGPDGMLYAGTGDAQEPERAQSISSLNGKVLRMTPDGGVPSDNPFQGSYVYAYGLRNVEGLAWNPVNKDFWVTMHGPTGEFGLYARDSVFIVPKGGNCGWPRTLGVTDIKGVVPPILYFPELSEPPGGATFYSASLMPHLKGDFFFASLAGQQLYRIILSSPRSISRIERWFATGSHAGKFGRLRTVIQGPDGALYLTTSNRDGRGPVYPGDDKVLRISPQ